MSRRNPGYAGKRRGTWLRGFASTSLAPCGCKARSNGALSTRCTGLLIIPDGKLSDVIAGRMKMIIRGDNGRSCVDPGIPVVLTHSIIASVSSLPFTKIFDCD